MIHDIKKACGISDKEMTCIHRKQCMSFDVIYISLTVMTVIVSQVC